jgi:phosphotransferase system enzyme I (PtsP)
LLERLRQITQEVYSASSTRESLKLLVNRICQVLEVEVCSVYLADYASQQLVLMATQGLNPKIEGVLHLAFHEGIVGLVAQREEPINLDNAPSHPNYRYFPEAAEEKFNAFLGVPIVHQRKVLGVLVVQQKLPRRFSTDEENFLVTLSAQVAGLLASSESRDQLSVQNLDTALVRQLKGLPTAPGIAIGAAVVFYPPSELTGIPDKPAQSIAVEIQKIEKAFHLAAQEIAAMKKRMAGSLGEDELSLFDAYLKILDKKGLMRDVLVEVEAGQWAPGALRRAVEKHMRVFEAMEDPYFRERATDLMDLARRVLMFLENDQATRPKLNHPAVLVAEEVTAAMLAELPIENILGMVSMRGSTTSHAAVLAKALGIPGITGLDDIPINRFEGQELIVDGYQGLLFIAPSDGLKQKYHRLMVEEQTLAHELSLQASEPALTLDGVHIPLLINTGLMADFEHSLSAGADGVGLYRTEIPFLLRDHFPGEEEQVQIYRSALKAFKGKTVNFRMLDIGGDKQLPYFPINEDNPFLGWRGIRVTLDHPEIFLVQARAIFKAASDFPDIKISLPMISTVEEVDEALRLLQQAYFEVKQELAFDRPMPPIGIILEVPSAIYQLPFIAKRVDFISVGSNDLAQYLLAVDRNNARVSSLFNYFHPALIAALHQIKNHCEKHRVALNICGEMAGDPMAAVILIGLGYQGLSMNAHALPKVKKVIRSFTKTEAEQAVQHILTLEKAKDIHAYLFEIMEAKGLGGLIRAGI